jgi:hypothetical protein
MLCRVLFHSATALTGLFGVAHFTGFLAARHAARTDPALAEVTRLMRAHVSPLGGMSPSLLDFREYFSAAFSPLLLTIALLNYLALRHAADPTAMLRALCLVNIGAMLILLALSIYHSIFQGILTCALIAALFLAAWLTS